MLGRTLSLLLFWASGGLCEPRLSIEKYPKNLEEKAGKFPHLQSTVYAFTNDAWAASRKYKETPAILTFVGGELENKLRNVSDFQLCLDERKNEQTSLLENLTYAYCKGVMDHGGRFFDVISVSLDKFDTSQGGRDQKELDEIYRRTMNKLKVALLAPLKHERKTLILGVTQTGYDGPQAEGLLDKWAWALNVYGSFYKTIVFALPDVTPGGLTALRNHVEQIFQNLGGIEASFNEIYVDRWGPSRRRLQIENGIFFEQKSTLQAAKGRTKVAVLNFAGELKNWEKSTGQQKALLDGSYLGGCFQKLAVKEGGLKNCALGVSTYAYCEDVGTRDGNDVVDIVSIRIPKQENGGQLDKQGDQKRIDAAVLVPHAYKKLRVENLILGAIGTGHSALPVDYIAKLFANAVHFYGGFYRQIEFAIPQKDKLEKFKKSFQTHYTIIGQRTPTGSSSSTSQDRQDQAPPARAGPAGPAPPPPAGPDPAGPPPAGAGGPGRGRAGPAGGPARAGPDPAGPPPAGAGRAGRGRAGPAAGPAGGTARAGPPPAGPAGAGPAPDQDRQDQARPAGPPPVFATYVSNFPAEQLDTKGEPLVTEKDKLVNIPIERVPFVKKTAFEAVNQWTTRPTRPEYREHIAVLNFAGTPSKYEHSGGQQKSLRRESNFDDCFEQLDKKVGLAAISLKGLRYTYCRQVTTNRGDAVSIISVQLRSLSNEIGNAVRNGKTADDIAQLKRAIRRDTVSKLKMAVLAPQIHGAEVLVLGAIGTGIFGHDLKTIAKLYASPVFLYRTYYKAIIFAVPDFPDDPPQFGAFKKAFYAAFRNRENIRSRVRKLRERQAGAKKRHGAIAYKLGSLLDVVHETFTTRDEEDPIAVAVTFAGGIKNWQEANGQAGLLLDGSDFGSCFEDLACQNGWETHFLGESNYGHCGWVRTDKEDDIQVVSVNTPKLEADGSLPYAKIEAIVGGACNRAKILVLGDIGTGTDQEIQGFSQALRKFGSCYNKIIFASSDDKKLFKMRKTILQPGIPPSQRQDVGCSIM